MSSAPKYFAQLWASLDVPNRGRSLRALADHVVVNERTNAVEVRLVDFATAVAVPADNPNAA